MYSKYFKPIVTLFLSMLSLILLENCQDQIIDVVENNLINTSKSIRYSKVADLSLYTNLNSGDLIPDRFIISLDDEKIKSYKNLDIKSKKEKKNEIKQHIEEVVSQLIRDYKVDDYEVVDVFPLVLEGFSIRMKAELVEKLKNDKRIKSIKNDVIIKIEEPSSSNVTEKLNKVVMESQVIPYGVKRVGGPFDGSQSTRKAWILDTGIDLDHPDLNVIQNLSTSLIGGSAEDGHGHGTHIAGTIAAKNNSFGVVGVAAGASVVAVKTFNSSGIGSASTQISGLNYIANNGNAGDVINCSWGWHSNDPGNDANISSAINDIANLGFLVTIAAGNDNGPVSLIYPAGNVGHQNCFVISGIDSTDNRYVYSNYGSTIDFALPAVKVLSTYKNGQYYHLSGTSMAAPHMAGMLLYYYNIVVPLSSMFDITGTMRNDPDGMPDQIPALINTIVENFNDQQINDNQSTIWVSPYPYYNSDFSTNNKYLHIGGSSQNPSNTMLASTESLNRSIGGLYVSFNIKVNYSNGSDDWAAFHMLKNSYNDVPINDGYWSQSGTFITIRNNGEVKLRNPYYTIATASYSPGFSEWRHVEVFYTGSTFTVYVDKSFVLQGTYSGSNNGQYCGFYTKACNVDFDELVVRNTINQ